MTSPRSQANQDPTAPAQKDATSPAQHDDRSITDKLNRLASGVAPSWRHMSREYDKELAEEGLKWSDGGSPARIEPDSPEAFNPGDLPDLTEHPEWPGNENINLPTPLPYQDSPEDPEHELEAESNVKLGKRPRKSPSSDEADAENTQDPVAEPSASNAVTGPNIAEIDGVEIDLEDINIGGRKYKTSRYWCTKGTVPAHTEKYMRGEAEQADWICRRCIVQHRLTINPIDHPNLTDEDRAVARRGGVKYAQARCKDPKCDVVISIGSRLVRGGSTVQSYPLAKEGQVVMAWICECSIRPGRKDTVIHAPHFDKCKRDDCGIPRESTGNHPMLAPLMSS